MRTGQTATAGSGGTLEAQREGANGVQNWTSPKTGRSFHLGVTRHPDRNPNRHLLRLVPPPAPDYTKMRSLQAFNRMSQPFDQGQAGSCTANSGALVAQICDGVMGLSTVRIYSREWLYYIEREYMGTLPHDSGADVIDEVDAPEKYGGLIIDSVWTYDSKPAEKPPATAATAAKFNAVAAYQPIASSDFLDGILTALDNNQPVAIGLNWYKGWFTDFENLGYLTASSMDSVEGGHALTLKGYVPPCTTFPHGAYAVQNSWGTTSPANTALWADSKPGDVLIPVEILANPAVGADAYAAVPWTAPATLSVAITPPSSVVAGTPAAFSAAVIGLPSGSIVTWQWDFGDGGQASTGNAAHTFAAAGAYTVRATVSVATTGATATASTTVSVT
jgi:hypothetical protein